MAIFLHFLNREAYRAAEAQYIPDRILWYLRVLSVARADALYSNFSNLMEGGFLEPTGPSLVRCLIETRQLLIAGERPCLSEFIESRTLRYYFDADRYPMYFGRSGRYDNLQPALLGRTSSTDCIQQSIEGVAQRQLSLADLHVHPSDRAALGSAIEDLREIVRRRESRGITRSLFSGKLKTLQQEGAAARLISVGYIDRYLQELRCTIATGIPELAVFDHLAADHCCADVQILGTLMQLSGFRENAALEKENNDKLFALLRGHSDQQQYARRIAGVCGVLRRMFPPTEGYLPALVKDFIAQMPIQRVRALDPTASIYVAANEQLARVIQSLRASSVFSLAYEAEMIQDGRVGTVLLVTATKTETQALFDIFTELTSGVRTYLTKANYVASELGQIGKTRVLHVQCEPGSVGPSSSQAVITDAIRDFSPRAIILAGIAFGAWPEKQRLGDILVSKTVVEYEKAKVKQDETIPRGQRIEASPKLISLFRAADAEGLGEPERVQVGVMLSGEKLIDSDRFVQELLATEPEAIGGEMEGAGLVAAAQRQGIDWIVIKAIVDWARDKKSQNSADHQINAARGAFRFVLQALDRIGL